MFIRWLTLMPPPTWSEQVHSSWKHFSLYTVRNHNQLLHSAEFGKGLCCHFSRCFQTSQSTWRQQVEPGKSSVNLTLRVLSIECSLINLLCAHVKDLKPPCLCPSSATINLQHIGEQAEAMFGVGYVIVHAVHVQICTFIDQAVFSHMCGVFVCTGRGTVS